MADSRAGAGKVLDKPGISCGAGKWGIPRQNRGQGGSCGSGKVRVMLDGERGEEGIQEREHRWLGAA